MKKNTKLVLIGGIALTTIVAIGFAFKNKLFPKKWKFLDNFYSKSVIPEASTGVGFIGEMEPPFKAGDTVKVVQDEGAKYSGYDGETVIGGVAQIKEGENTGKWVVDVPFAFLGNTPVNAGTITLV